MGTIWRRTKRCVPSSDNYLHKNFVLRHHTVFWETKSEPTIVLFLWFLGSRCPTFPRRSSDRDGDPEVPLRCPRLPPNHACIKHGKRRKVSKDSKREDGTRRSQEGLSPGGSVVAELFHRLQGHFGREPERRGLSVGDWARGRYGPGGDLRGEGVALATGSRGRSPRTCALRRGPGPKAGGPRARRALREAPLNRVPGSSPSWPPEARRDHPAPAPRPPLQTRRGPDRTRRPPRRRETRGPALSTGSAPPAPSFDPGAKPRPSPGRAWTRTSAPIFTRRRRALDRGTGQGLAGPLRALWPGGGPRRPSTWMTRSAAADAGSVLPGTFTLTFSGDVDLQPPGLYSHVVLPSGDWDWGLGRPREEGWSEGRRQEKNGLEREAKEAG